MKIILIAGATSMIGRACIETLDQEQNTLILMGRDGAALKEISKNIKNKHHILAHDLSSHAGTAELVRNLVKKYGRIDALIYNIAIYPWKKMEELTSQEWEQTLNINLSGAFALTQAAIHSFKEQRQGKIIYISSLAGEIKGLPHMSAYGATKAGLNGLMRTCALELAPFNINVNSISPGKVYDHTTLTKEQVTEKLEIVPLKRFIDPLDIAHMVEFLISKKAQNITGQNFIVDGGQSIV